MQCNFGVFQLDPARVVGPGKAVKLSVIGSKEHTLELTANLDAGDSAWKAMTQQLVVAPIDEESNFVGTGRNEHVQLRIVFHNVKVDVLLSGRQELPGSKL